MFGRDKVTLKKIITAVIIVALVLAAFTVLSTTPVKAQASEAQVLSYTWYVAPADTSLAEYAGDLVAVGEIQNVGSGVLAQVDVSGTAYNGTGSNATVLNQNSNSVFGNNLLPGQKAPFYIDFPPEDSVTQDQTYIPLVSNVSVVVSYVEDSNSTPYTDLTTTGVTSFLDNTGTFNVQGTIQNTGTQTVQQIVAVTTFYNATGQVVSLNFTNYLTDASGSSSLTPDDSMQFTATPTDNSAALSSEIANYSVLVESSLPVSTTPTSTPTTTATPSSSSTTTPTQTPTQISPAVTYGIIAIVVVVVVALVALLFLRKRGTHAEAEPPPPPPPPPPPT